MEQEQEHIDELIARVLSGEATAEEKEHLDHWSERNETNRKYLAQFRAVFLAASRPMVDFDANAAWTKVSARIAGNTPPGQVIPLKKRQVSPRVYSIAAAVAALIVFTWLLADQFMGESTRITASTENISDSLADGSFVQVKKGSEISFTQNKRERKVTLKGEAFFEIRHDDDQKFIVETGKVLIEDIGTAFNVRSTQDNDTVEVYVKEGVVRFYTKKDDGILVNAGQTGTYSVISGKFSITEIPSENVTSWADKEFRFRNSPLRKVVKKLNEVYDLPIELSSESLGDCRITVNFVKDDIHTIAEVIAETLNLTVKTTDSAIVLEGEGCE